MFTGIVEETGKISRLEKTGGNLQIYVEAKMTPELKIDQSVAHNGVCLTVVAINGLEYQVTAIDETLKKTNLSDPRSTPFLVDLFFVHHHVKLCHHY